MQKDTISSLLENLKDPKSLEIKDFLDRSSKLNSSILFYGETGTGKDFWANYLFLKSNKEKFINLNCGDVPETLLESEWFGYKKGSFTGASEDFEGRWSLAENGILFLNQIDLLTVGMQARLLRILENRKYFSIGSREEKHINARFLFSTDGDIKEKIKNGTFRKDLFFRISSLSLLIPPLRERKNDILPILNYYANTKGLKVNLTSKGKENLLSFRWPGNIRELENFVNDISIRKDIIEDIDTEKLSEALFFAETHIFEEQPAWKELEKRYIEFLLKKHGNRSKVARILKISRKSLYNKIKKYGKD